MNFNIIICMIIAYKFQLIKCKPQSDQFNRYNHSDKSFTLNNPYYRSNVQEPITTTIRNLYPTLHPTNNPAYYRHSNDDIGQRQVPVNPFGLPSLQPNINYNNRNLSSNNNFDYPYGNSWTPTTYPPFDGSTRRNTFPTRRQFNTLPPSSSSHSTFNNTNPNYNQYTHNRNNPSVNNGGNYYQHQHDHYNHYNASNRPLTDPLYPNNGNQYPYRHFSNAGNNNFQDSTNKPIPNTGYHQQGTNKPFSNVGYHDQYPIRSPLNTGNYHQDPNRPFGNTEINHQNQYKFNDNNTAHQHHPFPDPNLNDGRNQYQSNNQRNNVQFPFNMNSGLLNRNNFNIPSAAPKVSQASSLNQPTVSQQPDLDPNGIGLAPFPDESSSPANYGARKYFNYDNLYHRYPSQTNFGIKDSIRQQSAVSNSYIGQANIGSRHDEQTNINSRYGGPTNLGGRYSEQTNINGNFNVNDGTKIPLAPLVGSQVPLAPF